MANRKIKIVSGLYCAGLLFGAIYSGNDFWRYESEAIEIRAEIDSSTKTTSFQDIEKLETRLSYVKSRREIALLSVVDALAGCLASLGVSKLADRLTLENPKKPSKVKDTGSSNVAMPKKLNTADTGIAVSIPTNIVGPFCLIPPALEDATHLATSPYQYDLV